MRQTINIIHSDDGLVDIDYTALNDGTTQTPPVDGDLVTLELREGLNCQLVFLEDQDTPADQIGNRLTDKDIKGFRYSSDKRAMLKSIGGESEVLISWGAF